MSRNRSENPVVLSRIYTRTGDDGSTALVDGSRTAKTDSRLAAYADVEEANCAIGMAITFGELAPDIATLLTRVQNELFDVGADLANPVTDKPAPYPPLRIDEAYITRLEAECDSYNADTADAAQLPAAGRKPGRDAAAHGADRHPPGRAQRVGRGRRARRLGQPAARPLPEPAVRPAVHLVPGGQRRTRRRAVEAGRRTLSGAGWLGGLRRVQVGAGRSGLEPGEQAGERRVGQGQLHACCPVRRCRHRADTPPRSCRAPGWPPPRRWAAGARPGSARAGGRSLPAASTPGTC
jgi:ATP:cob(I)alamin adenosyltransferase